MKKTLSAKSVAIHGLWRCLAFCVACGIPSVASAQTQTLRIVTYNIDSDQAKTALSIRFRNPV